MISLALHYIFMFIYLNQHNSGCKFGRENLPVLVRPVLPEEEGGYKIIIPEEESRYKITMPAEANHFH